MRNLKSRGDSLGKVFLYESQQCWVTLWSTCWYGAKMYSFWAEIWHQYGYDIKLVVSNDNIKQSSICLHTLLQIEDCQSHFVTLKDWNYWRSAPPVTVPLAAHLLTFWLKLITLDIFPVNSSWTLVQFQVTVSASVTRRFCLCLHISLHSLKHFTTLQNGTVLLRFMGSVVINISVINTLHLF